MKPSDFFVEEEDPQWDLHGRDPWNRFHTIFDSEYVERLRRNPGEGVTDVETAYGLTKLAHEELHKFSASSEEPRLSGEELTTVLRTLRAVLKRIDIKFNPPFWDFKGFHGYWSAHSMGGSWAARRGYLNELFSPILSRLDELEDEQNSFKSLRGVDGELKNLIFASNGPKPEIVLVDAINNIIRVTKNADRSLFYDQPLTKDGLAWGRLVEWWRVANKLGDLPFDDAARQLYGRLNESLGENPVEKRVFRIYCEQYASDEAKSLPALIPQVYLHYDPLTRRQRGGQDSILARERMDFLLLLPNHIRIIIEVDGKQHYADGEIASPRLYSKMAAADRRLRLQGYEVYRFGGFELMQPNTDDMLRAFFRDLLAKYA